MIGFSQLKFFAPFSMQCSSRALSKNSVNGRSSWTSTSRQSTSSSCCGKTNNLKSGSSSTMVISLRVALSSPTAPTAARSRFSGAPAHHACFPARKVAGPNSSHQLGEKAGHQIARRAPCVYLALLINVQTASKSCLLFLLLVVATSMSPSRFINVRYHRLLLVPLTVFLSLNASSR
jgi:hypothetical protein